MRRATGLVLALTSAGLLGMAASPEHTRDAFRKAIASEEDAALIADLDQWEEQAVAEHFEFLRSLEVLQEALPEQPATPEEAK